MSEPRWADLWGIDPTFTDLPADPWDACRDVDPFTGQPDQHPCGDSCEGECE